jgi:hypothetical protein
MNASETNLPRRKNMAKIAAGYVAAGLTVVKLHRTTAIGVCSCTAGAECPNPGKHPMGNAWALHAATFDEDTAMGWWANDDTAPNIGVILGPTYAKERAVIDVEADTDEGIGILRELGMERFQTGTYESGKSPHRLFWHEDGLPPTSYFSYRGVEIRLGHGKKMTQSVLPPSIHPSGKLYRWQDGLSLDEVGIAPLPDNLRAWILEAWDAYRAEKDGKGAGGARKGSSLAILGRTHFAANSERHNALMRYAGFLSRSVRLGNAEDESLFLGALRSANATQCEPPKGDEEVKAIWRDALKYRYREVVQAQLCEGISAVIDGGVQRFVPDGLELTLVQSDPPAYRLFCEAWKAFNGTGLATLSADDFMSAKKSSVALVTQVAGLQIDRWPGDWAGIWDGRAGKPGSGGREAVAPVVGLKTLLIEEATRAGRIEVVDDPAQNRLRRLALMLYSQLLSKAGAPMIREEAEYREGRTLFANSGRWLPNITDRDGPPVLWFGWQDIWRMVEQQNKVEVNECNRLLAAMPQIIGRKLSSVKKTIHGARSTFKTLTVEEWGRLESFANGNAENPSSSQPDFAVAPELKKAAGGRTVVRAHDGQAFVS